MALGSDSQAGQPAVGARPAPLPQRRAARARHERRGARRAGPTSSSGASRTSAPRRSIRPAAGVVVDLSGAHRIADTALYPQWYGFEHPKPERRRLVLRAAGAAAADGPADREPRLLRDRRDARARAAARRRRPGHGRRRREVGRVGRGPHAERARSRAPCSRTTSRTRSAAHRHVLEMELMLGFAPAFVPHLLPIRRGPARDLLRPRRRCRRRARAARGGVRRLAGRAGAARGRRARRSSASWTPTASRSASSPTRRAGARS